MHRVLLALGFAVCFAGYSAAYPDTFSIDSQSPSAPQYHPDNILTPGPTIHVPGPNIGLQPLLDDLDALSSGWDKGSILYFSVDRSSVGLSTNVPGYTVFSEAQNHQAAGDIFVTCNPIGTFTPPLGYNTLMVNQSNWGLKPLIPAGTLNASGMQDNVNAFNFDEFDIWGGSISSPGDGKPDRAVYFSLARGSASLPGRASAADVLIFDPNDPTVPPGNPFKIYADGITSIGLKQGDDIDALALLDFMNHGTLDPNQDSALFSLAPGSPTLAAGGYSAADIFQTSFNGTFSLFAPAAALGLAPGDNVDALEVQPAVPEPCSLLLLGLGAMGLVAYRRRS